MRTGKTFVLNSELGQPLSRGKETWYNLCTGLTIMYAYSVHFTIIFISR